MARLAVLCFPVLRASEECSMLQKEPWAVRFPHFFRGKHCDKGECAKKIGDDGGDRMPSLDIFSFYQFWGGYSGSCSLWGLEYAFTFWHS